MSRIGPAQVLAALELVRDTISHYKWKMLYFTYQIYWDNTNNKMFLNVTNYFHVVVGKVKIKLGNENENMNPVTAQLHRTKP